MDEYYANEHLETLIEALLGKNDSRCFSRRGHHWRKLLLADGVERIIRRGRKEALGAPR